jgi:hypothetical protein
MIARLDSRVSTRRQAPRPFGAAAFAAFNSAELVADANDQHVDIGLVQDLP